MFEGDRVATDTAERYREWIGRRQSTEDDLSPSVARRAAALFDRDDLDVGIGCPLPPLWHWFHFLPSAPQARLSEDGHPERGDFIPPIPLPRRMFAGARTRFVRPLLMGRPAVREAEIRDVKLKTGRSGRLAFVTVMHRIRQEGELCIEEERDIVYREAGGGVAAPVPVEPEPAPEGTWERHVTPDPRLLFRFSALTFNAHRIHYDRPYATEVEGYPALVVHGPLNAMLLAELVQARDPRPIRHFSFRGRAPVFDLGPIRLLGTPDGRRVELQARGPDDVPALTAQATLSE
jgi:3-methylfumaryl-CoA hydratase